MASDFSLMLSSFLYTTIFSKEKRVKKKAIHPCEGVQKSKFFWKNTTRMGGDFYRNP